MKKYIHCAFVRHNNGFSNTYLFTVPVEEKIKANTKVICHTKRGEKEGQLVSDSFWVSEEALKSICPVVGATLPLKNVIGTLETRTVTAKSYFCGIDDIEDAPINIPF